MEHIYNKLVRDKIPDIIEADNRISVTRILDDEEYEKELVNKLLEEAKEVENAKNDEEVVKELADVLEVLRYIAKTKGKTLDDIIKLADDKKEKRGGFDYKIFLEKEISEE